VFGRVIIEVNYYIWRNAQYSSSDTSWSWSGRRTPIVSECSALRSMTMHALPRGSDVRQALKALDLHTLCIIGPHCIAMHRRAYILPLVFLCFFSSPNLWGHWTDLNQTGHTFTYDCYLKNLVQTPPGYKFTPTAFWDRLWTLSEHTSAMEHDINNRKEICQSTETRSLHSRQIWWILVQKRLKTVGEFLPSS